MILLDDIFSNKEVDITIELYSTNEDEYRPLKIILTRNYGKEGYVETKFERHLVENNVIISLIKQAPTEIRLRVYNIRLKYYFLA